ncbi:MAG: GAF domain-containing SpoIIE family protein phosphatase [Planctomycetota bacterium]
MAVQDELTNLRAELTAVTNVSRMLAESRDLPMLLERTVKLITDVMGVKAASIRLLDTTQDELTIAAKHGLSDAYLGKGKISFTAAKIDQAALSPRGWELVEQVTDDPRVLFREQAIREGIVSILVAGMRYLGKPIGVLRVYTDKPRRFSEREIDLLRTVASMAAAAIENVRLADEARQVERDAERLERQVQLAANVQQRMLPKGPPEIEGMSLAGIYQPAQELAGDLYDYIPLPEENHGLLVADVSGKGVAAALVGMAVRASLRAQVDYKYDLSESIAGLNHMLYRDTRPGEFVTLFYAVLDAQARRLTYCAAGHPPALLWRNGKLRELTTDDMLLGIDLDATFGQGVFKLRSGDRMLIYTDGFPDAEDFRGEHFGEERVAEAFTEAAKLESAGAMAEHMRRMLRNFVGLADRNDDVTFITLHVE